MFPTKHMKFRMLGGYIQFEYSEVVHVLETSVCTHVARINIFLRKMGKGVCDFELH